MIYLMQILSKIQDLKRFEACFSTQNIYELLNDDEDSEVGLNEVCQSILISEFGLELEDTNQLTKFANVVIDERKMKAAVATMESLRYVQMYDNHMEKFNG